MDDADLGRRLVETLGEPACRELPTVLERPDDYRAALVGHLYATNYGRGVAEILLDIETDPEGLLQLRLILALREVLGVEG